MKFIYHLLLDLECFFTNHNGSCAAYMSNPCHIELMLSEKEEPVKKEVSISDILFLYL
jgi:hypothetical protein